MKHRSAGEGTMTKRWIVALLVYTAGRRTSAYPIPDSFNGRWSLAYLRYSRRRTVHPRYRLEAGDTTQFIMAQCHMLAHLKVTSDG